MGLGTAAEELVKDDRNDDEDDGVAGECKFRRSLRWNGSVYVFSVRCRCFGAKDIETWPQGYNGLTEPLKLSNFKVPWSHVNVAWTTKIKILSTNGRLGVIGSTEIRLRDLHLSSVIWNAVNMKWIFLPRKGGLRRRIVLDRGQLAVFVFSLVTSTTVGHNNSRKSNSSDMSQLSTHFERPRIFMCNELVNSTIQYYTVAVRSNLWGCVTLRPLFRSQFCLVYRGGHFGRLTMEPPWFKR